MRQNLDTDKVVQDVIFAVLIDIISSGPVPRSACVW